ncbi:hypothetical protein QJS10_CPA02g01469 [Acorus calamus]|uniref:Uncharacterized protein n=1 Tax=Acorus calamus TaxID=4465 RepID=A0AAV9FBV5_ACOCL|nr:hypothetical protein QJS10_CPA02g01469 [Acorus calamus]
MGCPEKPVEEIPSNSTKQSNEPSGSVSNKTINRQHSKFQEALADLGGPEKGQWQTVPPRRRQRVAP